MEMAAVAGGIIAVVVLGAFMFMFPGNLMGNVEENVTTTTPGMIKLDKYSVYPTEYYGSEGSYKYKVRIYTEISFLGKMDSDVVAIPVLQFKEQSMKMDLIEQGLGIAVYDKYFPLIPVSTKKFQGDLKAEIDSTVPPIVDFSLWGKPLTEGQTVIVDKDILVSAIEIDKSILETLTLGTTCRAKFRIGCGDDTKSDIKTLSLLDEDDKREGDVTVCGANVKIHINDIESCRKADVSIITTAVTQRDYSEVKETMWLSLWKKSDCVMIWDSYDDLFEHCYDEFLGRYKIEAPLLKWEP